MIWQYKEAFAKVLSPELWLPETEVLTMIERTPDNIQGDLAFPCFTLAKALKKSPMQIAQDLSTKLTESNGSTEFTEFTQAWPYVNAHIDSVNLSKAVITKVLEEKENFGKGSQKNETILVESPGPNTNKPLHLGHVRNMLLGNSLTKILQYAGYEVKKVDIINDRGIHICKSMLAYQKFGNNADPDKKSDHFVGDRYVRYSSELEDHPEMEDEIKDMLVQRENNDQETRKLRKKMNKRAIEGMRETYERFGCTIDKTYYESEHYESGKAVVKEGTQKGVFIKNEKGNIVCNLEEEKLGHKTVLRADGTSVYATQDMGLAKQRFEDFNMKKMIYIVGSEQEDHFKSVFAMFKKLGRSFAEQCFHLSYGMISLPSGRMKSREGTVVDADNLISDLHTQAAKNLQSRDPDIDPETKEQKAEAIAMAAIKFFILKYDTSKNFVFNPEESLSFEGETGPYIQYTYARCQSILDKYNQEYKTYEAEHSTADEASKALLLQLADFPEVVEAAAQEYKPNLIARFVLELAQSFNAYYQKNKILTEDHAQTAYRVLLVQTVQQVIAAATKLLGIETPAKM